MFTVKKRLLVILLIIVTVVCALLFSAIYREAEKNAIKKLNYEQIIDAKLAALGIQDFFGTWSRVMSSYAKIDEIVNIDADGKRYMNLLYEAHQDQIRSVTRMDEKGTIIYTVPFSSSIGNNISNQKHVREILTTHKPVVSDVFRAVQGFDAIVLHVPVFSGPAFKGTIAVLINFESLAKRYLDVIKIGETGYAWVVSREGIQLYSPTHDFVGKSVYENFKGHPSAIAMVDEMLKGHEGTAEYTFDRIGDRHVGLIKKYAVYLPIQLNNTFWSIAVTSGEQDMLSDMVSFRNRLVLIIGIVFIFGIVVSVFGAKSWLIVEQDERRRKAEEHRRHAERRYRDLFNDAPVMYVLTSNIEGVPIIIDCNEAFLKALDFAREEVVGRPLSDFYTSSSRMAMQENGYLRALQGRFDIEERELVTREGVIIATLLQALPERSTDGMVTGTRAAFIDITERKRAENELRESKALVDAVIENVPLMIFLKEAKDLRFVIFNRAGEDLVGYDRKDMLGKNNLDLFPPEQAAHFMAKDREVLDGETGVMDIPEEAILTNKKGQRVLHTRKVCIRGGDGTTKYLLGISEDITEHRKLEEQLRQSQKMESVGTLAGGVAHDFNNILSAIIGYGEMALVKMDKDDPNRQNIEQILQASDRAAHLTKDLLLFSRKQPIERKPYDLNEGIQKLGKFLIRVIGEDIDFKTHLSGGIIPILADEHQISQVLMNLATNARDVMPKGGTFTITVEQVNLDKELTSKHDLGMPGTYAMISVSDTGHGMDEITRQRIFEPFFTTKEVGKGTGLGLAVVYGIIKKHEGSINVYSEPGIGTTFKIYLPIIESDTFDEKTPVAEEHPAGGTETILLAEDDETLRRLTKSVLEEFGYEVIIAIDGEDAIIKFADNKDRIALLLTDLIMPKKSGKEAYDAIKKMRPDIKVIFASGYSPDIVQDKASLEPDATMLFKPVSPIELLRKVRDVLNS